MPASIAHMLISRRTRACLKDIPETAQFVVDVLDKHPHYMELGSLGPDLPYFGWRSLVDPNLPLGVDQWSYQLHSKSPNSFPLQLLEVILRSRDPATTPENDGSHCKLSFLCGYLTHVAADQIIHPVVNSIAGSYSQSKLARKEHKNCEIHQDVYVLSGRHDGHLSDLEFRSERFHEWCNPNLDDWSTPLFTGASVWDFIWVLRRVVQWPPPCPNDFVYFIQKAFVEAHAVTPTEFRVERWMKALWWLMFTTNHRPRRWYQNARNALFGEDGVLTKDSREYGDYILLNKAANKRHSNYDEYLEEAVELATIYIRAAFRLYRATMLDDPLRLTFKTVVINADLGSPLDTDILETAQVHFDEWETIERRFRTQAMPMAAAAKKCG